MSIRQTFCDWISSAVINKYDKGAVMQIWTVLGHVYHVACRRVVHLDFLDFFLATFLEYVTSELQKLWGSSLFWKSFKFNLDFKNVAKNWENVFCLWDNCIWIGIVKFSLLRTRYFLSAANVLTSSPNIWHVNKRDFFQVNWLGSDQ